MIWVAFGVLLFCIVCLAIDQGRLRMAYESRYGEPHSIVPAPVTDTAWRSLANRVAVLEEADDPLDVNTGKPLRPWQKACRKSEEEAS